MHNYVGLFSDQIAYLDAKESNRNIRKLLYSLLTLYLLLLSHIFLTQFKANIDLLCIRVLNHI